MRAAREDVCRRGLVTVVIPHRNTPAALDRCVRSLRHHSSGLEHEILLVDNGSDVCSMPRLEIGSHVRVLHNASNRGFAAACNQAATLARGEYLLFLNSDVELDPGALTRMVRTLDGDPSIAAVAPLQRGSGGSAESPARSWLGPMTQARALLGDVRARAPHPIAWSALAGASWVAATALLVRARVFHLVGGFDEDYFFYEEDEDFGWRLVRRGYRIAVCRDASVLHDGGLSASAAGAWPVLALYAGQVRFVRRRWGLVGECLYRLTTCAAIAVKATRGHVRGAASPSLARAAPTRVLRLLCSCRRQSHLVGK